MSIIYSFLQKRKMHESNHGYIMIFIAYVLSALMLVLGSDAFYDLQPALARTNEKTQEETQNLFHIKLNDLQLSDSTAQIPATIRINPYGLPENTTETNQMDKQSSEVSWVSEATVWMLGDAMDGETFDSLMEQMSSMKSIRASIQSLSVKESKSKAYGDITDKEVTLLERIVQAEAGGEDQIGKILIVNVIMNRVASDHFPDTIKEVIFENSDGSYQFSPAKSGRIWSVKISDATVKAVHKALNGTDYSKGALYFVARKRSNANSVRWFDQQLERLFRHGGHEFYKNK